MSGPRPAANATAEHERLQVELHRLRTRLDTVERQIQALADANAALARALQADPLESPGVDRTGQAARHARELLLAAGLVGRANRAGGADASGRTEAREPGDGEEG